MTSRWWRAYDEALDDPKLQKLPAELFRHWFNLMCIASQNNGTLPCMEDLAFRLRVSSTFHAKEIVQQLVAAGLLDGTNDETFHPHNWRKRQYKSDLSTDRVKRFRKRCETVSETPPDTESDTESEKKKDVANATLPSSNLNKQFFDRCRELFGKNGGSIAAKILKAKDRDVAAARSLVEAAATKAEPLEYAMKVINGKATQRTEEPIWRETGPYLY